MILANPQAVPHIEGMTVGSLTVDSFAHRDGNGFRFNVRCTRCGDRWTESYRRIRDGFLNQGCRNTLCRLNRLPESKKTAYERWLDAPDPQPKPEPEPVNTGPIPEPVSPEYHRYFVHAMANRWAEVVTYARWKSVSDCGREWLLKKVAEEGG